MIDPAKALKAATHSRKGKGHVSTTDPHAPYVPPYEEHLPDFMPKGVTLTDVTTNDGYSFLRHENGDIEIVPVGTCAPHTFSRSEWKAITLEIGCGESPDDLYHRYLQTLPLEKLTRAQYAELIGEWTRQIGTMISMKLDLIALYTAGMANHAPTWETEQTAKVSESDHPDVEQAARVKDAQATRDDPTDTA